MENIDWSKLKWPKPLVMLPSGRPGEVTDALLLISAEIVAPNGVRVQASWVGTDRRLVHVTSPHQVTLGVAAPVVTFDPVPLSSGVLREVESVITGLSERFPQRLAEVLAENGLATADPHASYREKASALGSPNSRHPTYYRDLLALFDEMSADGHPRPVKALAELLDVPEGTVKSRLRTARRGGVLARPSDVED